MHEDIILRKLLKSEDIKEELNGIDLNKLTSLNRIDYEIQRAGSNELKLKLEFLRLIFESARSNQGRTAIRNNINDFI